MSKEWLKEFSVLVKAPVRRSSHDMMCVVKRQKAPTLEKAQELVANYGAYHRKKRGLVSEEAFSVIKNPVSFRIAYTYNRNDERSVRADLHLALEAAKSVVIRDSWFDGTDERNDDIFVIRINITGDACMRSFIENQLRFCQKENAIIDYCIQVEPYRGDDICNHYMIFKTFNDKFFV
jgi:hypothetical protein